MASITAGEILRFAVRMEKNGEKFYRDVAGASPLAKVNDLFLRLASEEAAHGNTFVRLVAKLDTYGPAEGYPSEYLDYFYHYVDNKNFFAEESKDSITASFDIIMKAFDFAIQMELNSVVLYKEMKLFVPVEDNRTIEAIIDEELRHVTQLSALKKKPN